MLVLRRGAKNVMRRGMRLTCPNCLTEYDVPDEAIAGRPRTVRCAHCGHQWRHGEVANDAPELDDLTEANPAPEAAPLIDAPPLLPEAMTVPAVPEPAAPEPAAPEPAAPRPGSAAEEALAARKAAFVPPPVPPRPPRRRSFGPAVIALLSLALVIGALAAHRPIMRVWPASAGFYQALGLG